MATAASVGRPNHFSRDKSSVKSSPVSSCPTLNPYPTSPSPSSCCDRLHFWAFATLSLSRVQARGICGFVLRWRVLESFFLSDFFLSDVLAPRGPQKSPRHSFCILSASHKHCHILFSLAWSTLYSSWYMAFGIKSHLGRSQTAATKPSSTEGRLITQLINPTDVTVNARFFVIWIYIAEIGFGPRWKCPFYQTLRNSIFLASPLCSCDTSLVFQKALPHYCSHRWCLCPECVSHRLPPGLSLVSCC